MTYDWYEVVPSALRNVLMLIICSLFDYAKLLRDTHYEYIERNYTRIFIYRIVKNYTCPQTQQINL